MNQRDVFGRDDVALPTATEATAVDREAEARHGIPSRVLMENAGRSAALVVDRLFPRGRVVAAVGGGNNGGDALVLLRTLRAWGRDVAALPVGRRAPDAALAHGHEVPRLDPGTASTAFADAAVVVDGILGTGATGAPREDAAAVVRQINASGRPVVALDVPTGVDPTTGRIPGEAVCANVTLCFGWPKQGLMFQPGRGRCGRLIALEIAFPPDSAGRPPSAALLTPGWAAARLPMRAPDAYKGTAGELLVLAGRAGVAGAAAIASHAAGRAGAGYVRLASSAANRAVLQTVVPEAVFVDRDDEAALAAAAATADAILVGPGMGTDADGRTAFERLLDRTPGTPALLDADALTLLGREPDAVRRRIGERPLVLTPHPGEAHRLSGWPIERIREAPLEAARSLAERFAAVVLLKGAPSVIAAPDVPTLIGTVGSSELAKAGMGDQLAGTIGAFLAAGVPARTAAALGLFYSGRAADLAARGPALQPRDVSEHLDRAFADPGPAVPPLGFPFITFDQPARW
ncbi:MAG TPA: NAD(P)H-hydrate dehydratase [Longimicrobiales bacterium]